MNHQASGVASDLELLKAQLVDLERRVAALERGEKKSARELAAPAESASRENLPLAGSTSSTSVVAVLGRAILGMAGAYLLRAAAEMEFVPRLAVVAAAVVYAGIWQSLSVRAGKNSRIAEAIYGITSALILFPMLWESTLRFRILPASATAALLFASVLCGMIFARKSAFPALPWATTIFSSVVGLGLLVATRDPLPFAVTLILTAALSEFAACVGRWAGLQIVTAISLNLALCALFYLATQPAGFPEEYKPIGMAALFVLFVATVLISVSASGYRAVHLRRQLAWWDIAQMVVAFALLFATVLELAGGAGKTAFGIACLLASAACYAGTYLNKEMSENSRTFRVYVSCGGALFLIGSYLAMPEGVRAPWLCLSAILITVLAGSRRLALGFHGFLWLIAAQTSAGVLAYAGRLFAESNPMTAPPNWWLLAGSATACSVVLSLREWDANGIRVLRFCSLANTSFLLSAFAVSGIATVLPRGAVSSASQLAFLRTFLICATTLVLALMGARWKRREFVWTAYTAIGLGAVKVLVQDWRTGSTSAFALSLLAFGLLLAVIPRLTRDNRAKFDA